MVAQSEVWQDVGRYKTVLWSVSDTDVQYERMMQLKTAGFLSIMHMATLMAGPDPVSPFLLRAAIEGTKTCLAIDRPFINRLEPSVHDALVPWMEQDLREPLPRTPRGGDLLAHLLFEHGLVVSISLLS